MTREAPAPTAPSGATRLILLTVSAALLLASLGAMIGWAIAPGQIEISPYVPSLWLMVHVICVIPAVPLGAYILLRRKGDRTHKMLGRIWGGLMIGAALSSFALKGLMGGSFSPIHLLSVLTLITIPRAIINIRRGNVAAHKRSMTVLYISLLIAGAFSFLPGRLMWTWLVG